MNILIKLTDAQIKTLLDAYDYVVEDVMLYYENGNDVYDTDVCETSYGCTKFKVAYESHKKPEELKRKMPLLSECRGYLYQNIIEKLFVKRYFEKLF